MGDRALPPGDIPAHDFFTRWVPESVARDLARQHHLRDTRAVLLFELDGEGGGIYTVAIAEGVVEGSPGDHHAPDLRIKLDVETWRALNDGSLSAPDAFLRRRVRLEGNLRLAVKLHVIIG
ncbi:MAG: SCP2 sterol-binding domain-containing protein [Myxococcota bacterium]|nr:SCP2 sterol-binding domain-containing protein [Myxococcota bacterium]